MMIFGVGGEKGGVGVIGWCDDGGEVGEEGVGFVGLRIGK